MDREKMAHELALAFAKAYLVADINSPEKQLNRLLENYCTAYGFFSSRTDERIKELIRRGEQPLS